jgi:hypothetical protein
MGVYVQKNQHFTKVFCVGLRRKCNGGTHF